MSVTHAISCPLCLWTMNGTGADAQKLLLVRLSAHFAVLHPGHDFPPDPRLGRSPVIASSGLAVTAQHVMHGRHRPPANAKSFH
jgi:hypothetical protein